MHVSQRFGWFLMFDKCFHLYAWKMSEQKPWLLGWIATRKYSIAACVETEGKMSDSERFPQKQKSKSINSKNHKSQASTKHIALTKNAKNNRKWNEKKNRRTIFLVFNKFTEKICFHSTNFVIFVVVNVVVAYCGCRLQLPSAVHSTIIGEKIFMHSLMAAPRHWAEKRRQWNEHKDALHSEAPTLYVLCVCVCCVLCVSKRTLLQRALAIV